ncbi:hypothetical protein [Jeotgalicoccus sp. WY2]|uniref:hypothetical protein n=1 Tax=Jeotgalicoccus sp. WY2 TaxID=2708346 RepID=UPI001BD1E814|nr:hypothetical protein [Jeotgalicoccus sp. WY2]
MTKNSLSKNDIGMSLAMAFSLVSVLLIWNPDFISAILPTDIMNYIIGGLSGFIGVIGFLSETGKSENNLLKSITTLFFASLSILIGLFFPYIIILIFGKNIIVYIINYLYIFPFLFLFTICISYLFKGIQNLLKELKTQKLLGITKLVGILGPCLTVLLQFKK